MSDTLRSEIREATLRPEADCLPDLLGVLALDNEAREAIAHRAADLVRDIREEDGAGMMEKFLAEYGLNTDEGVALMCLAEAYLRTPDAETLDALISDKIGERDWARHLGHAESALVNASTWALMLTGKVFRTIPAQAKDLASVMHGMVQRLGEPVARTAVGEAMKLMGRQFVLGRSIREALQNAIPSTEEGYLHSFDMLGEAARTAKDAARYFSSYAHAISVIGEQADQDDPHDNSGISVKLSALFARYETVNRARVMSELVPRVIELVRLARAVNIPIAIDAEEADRLDLSLDVIGAILADSTLHQWDGFGVVVQAYQRRAPAVLDWLHAQAREHSRRLSVRLVKGAYWDSEIKNAQVLGLAGYPVYTRKETTDVAYLACARKLLAMTDRLYPQFATHNAHTIAAISHMALQGEPARFEFQRLYGMGEAAHEIARKSDGHRRRIYAPVGVHKDLLAYLVRRLLENGANSSFVHRVLDRAIPAEAIAADPIAVVEAVSPLTHPSIPLPCDLYGAARRNSRGWNLNDPTDLEALEKAMTPFLAARWGDANRDGASRAVTNPADRNDIVGHVHDANEAQAKEAIARAAATFPEWSSQGAGARAAILERAADLFEENAAELMALCVREAGKTRFDAIAEIREAVDFLRYYAAQARETLGKRTGLGAVVCISPWNFPLAIFTGQVAGSLAAGNTVVAKPAEQSPLIAARAVEFLREAGVPADALKLVQGDGAIIGPALTGDRRVAGVVFTGSTETARLIDLSMAKDGNQAAALIAETGGLNAMIVDSTALAEQAVRDILASAFQSAGQRCSALRVLFVQKDIAPSLLEMLEGAARELGIGRPWNPSTDVGPVIDDDAKRIIDAHCERLEGEGRLLFRLATPPGCDAGTFVAPAAFRLDSMKELTREIFGPVLHVVTFEANEIDTIVDDINAAGYGLTLGIHSRIDSRIDAICARAHIGNIYVNRNQIGAVVGVQPFGGEGLSGTGPKAGGPLYLMRLSKSSKPLEPADALPDPAPRILPGPTGEKNSYTLRPRGLVACLGPDDHRQKEQARLAKNAGNAVMSTAIDDAAFRKALDEDRIAALMVDGEAPRELRIMLAEKQGKRVPVIAGTSDLHLLYAESSIAEDTTASGGNASLLAAVS